MYKNYREYKALKSNTYKNEPIVTKVTNNIYYPKKDKNHPKLSNYYIDNKGQYKEKPKFANFWKVGFLNDMPTRKDYNYEMDGIKYTDSLYTKNTYGYNQEQQWKDDIEAEEHDHLYGLERLQLSIMRLWNGAPREWIKLIVRVLILILFYTLCMSFFRFLLNTNFITF